MNKCEQQMTAGPKTQTTGDYRAGKCGFGSPTFDGEGGGTGIMYPITKGAQLTKGSLQDSLVAIAHLINCKAERS